MSDDLRSHGPREDVVHEDDAIIGRVFRWSLLVIVGLASIVALVVWVTRDTATEAAVVAKDVGTIADLDQSSEEMPKVTFVDVAGLVKGANEGQGLGNQFLAKLREMDVLVHVLRCFEDPSVAHVMETVDPETDLLIVEEEILLSDLAILDKALSLAKKRQERWPSAMQF